MNDPCTGICRNQSTKANKIKLDILPQYLTHFIKGGINKLSVVCCFLFSSIKAIAKMLLSPNIVNMKVVSNLPLNAYCIRGTWGEKYNH